MTASVDTWYVNGCNSSVTIYTDKYFPLWLLAISVASPLPLWRTKSRFLFVLWYKPFFSYFFAPSPVSFFRVIVLGARGPWLLADSCFPPARWHPSTQTGNWISVACQRSRDFHPFCALPLSLHTTHIYVYASTSTFAYSYMCLCITLSLSFSSSTSTLCWLPSWLPLSSKITATPAPKPVTAAAAVTTTPTETISSSQ